MEKAPLVVTGIMVGLMIALAVYGGIVVPGAGPDADWGLFYDGVFLTLLILFLYWNYDRFRQTILSYSLLMILALAHVAGALWYYGKSWGWFEFDMGMHLLGGIVLAVFFCNLFGGDKWYVISMTILATLGLSAIHELLEFGGYAIFGEGTGIFMYGVGDFGEYNDIAFDLGFNLIGAIIGTLLSMFRK